MKQRIFIVEDHEVVRESYTMFIDLRDDLEVCGAVASGEEALENVPQADPDLLLVDISLPGMSGIDLLEQLREAGVTVPALMLTGHDSASYQSEARRAGAQGFVMKQDGPAALSDAISEALNKV